MLRLLFYVALIAAVIYALLWILDRRSRGNATPAMKPGPKGPDDDPDFLWGLDRDRRHPRNQPDHRDDSQA